MKRKLKISIILVSIALANFVFFQNFSWNTLPSVNISFLIGRGSDKLPSWVAGFHDVAYMPDVQLPTDKQILRSQEISLGSIPKYEAFPGVSYHLSSADLSMADESTYIHSTDPANLRLFRAVKNGSNKFMLSWANDQRGPVRQYQVYKAYFPAHFVKPRAGNQWWRGQEVQWHHANAVSGQNSSLGVEIDLPVNPQENNGELQTCFMVKTVSFENVEKFFSYPQCGNFAQLENAENARLLAAKVRVATHSNGLAMISPIDNNFANVTYIIDTKMNESNTVLYQGYFAEVIYYIPCRDDLVNEECPQKEVRRNQTIGPLKQAGKRILYFKGSSGNSTGASTYLTLRRPYLDWVKWPVKASDGSGTYRPVDHVVFKIQVLVDGQEKLYPRDGGFYTVNTNNRVQDRLQFGDLLNPSDAWYLQKLSEKWGILSKSGHNAILFDSWNPNFMDGLYGEAPAIEFGQAQESEDYQLALDKVAETLRSQFQGIKLYGNVIEQGIRSQELRAMSKLDGTLWESGFVRHGEKVVGDEWLNQLNYIQTLMSEPWNKTVHVLPYLSPDRVRPLDLERSPLNPNIRLYSYGSALLATTRNSQANFFYGPIEFAELYQNAGLYFKRGHSLPKSKIGIEVNYLPEYLLDIGLPVENRQRVSDHIWQRAFTKGVVIVNAGATPYEFQPLIPTWTGRNYIRKVSIVNAAVVSDQDDQENLIYLQVDPGQLGYTNITAGQKVIANPGEAVIILY